MRFYTILCIFSVFSHKKATREDGVICKNLQNLIEVQAQENVFNNVLFLVILGY